MKVLRIALVLWGVMAAMEGVAARFYRHVPTVPRTGLRTGTNNNARRCANVGCNNTAASGKKFCATCQCVADEKAAQRAKAMMERLKKVSVQKVSFEKDGKILSLCGYELGTIFKKGPVFEVDESGEIVVSSRLKKPFRRCNNVVLRYGKDSGALYSICIFSSPQENMDSANAELECDAIVKALGTKFKDNISGWNRVGKIMNATYRCIPFADPQQSLVVAMSEEEIGSTGLIAAGKKGWAFSVTLKDSTVKDINLFDKSAEQVNAADIEAL